MQRRRGRRSKRRGERCSTGSQANPRCSTRLCRIRAHQKVFRACRQAGQCCLRQRRRHYNRRLNSLVAAPRFISLIFLSLLTADAAVNCMLPLLNITSRPDFQSATVTPLSARKRSPASHPHVKIPPAFRRKQRWLKFAKHLLKSAMLCLLFLRLQHFVPVILHVRVRAVQDATPAPTAV